MSSRITDMISGLNRRIELLGEQIARADRLLASSEEDIYAIDLGYEIDDQYIDTDSSDEDSSARLDEATLAYFNGYDVGYDSDEDSDTETIVEPWYDPYGTPDRADHANGPGYYSPFDDRLD